jgi:hypothetical protein
MSTDQASRKKLDPKSEKCIFVGYCETQKAYRFWNPLTRKIKISRDADFYEEGTVFDGYSLHFLPPVDLEVPDVRPPCNPAS